MVPVIEPTEAFLFGRTQCKLQPAEILASMSGPTWASLAQSQAAERSPRTAQQRSKTLDPGLRRGDESCPNAVPETKALHAAGNGEAEPAVAFPLLQRRVQPAAGGNCRVDV